MKNQIIKGFTLVFFSSLIVGFVAFRSGFWGGNKSTHPGSPNGSVLVTPTDSLPASDSLRTIHMMSSSKVLILRDHSVQAVDSPRIEIDSSITINPLMHSSKSGFILNPEDMDKLKPDSTATDSLKNQ